MIAACQDQRFEKAQEARKPAGLTAWKVWTCRHDRGRVARSDHRSSNLVHYLVGFIPGGMGLCAAQTARARLAGRTL